MEEQSRKIKFRGREIKYIPGETVEDDLRSIQESYRNSLLEDLEWMEKVLENLVGPGHYLNIRRTDDGNWVIQKSESPYSYFGKTLLEALEKYEKDNN
jgi:hypothetical protein